MMILVHIRAMPRNRAAPLRSSLEGSRQWRA